MSFVKSEDSRKWINSFVAVCSIVTGYVVIRFLGQLGEWFDLEAKIPHFLMIGQGVGIATGLLCFLMMVKHKVSSSLMAEVYDELVKAIWPDKDSVLKVTVGILIAVSILSGIFVSVDFLFRKVLELIY